MRNGGRRSAPSPVRLQSEDYATQVAREIDDMFPQRARSPTQTETDAPRFSSRSYRSSET